jgi:hypothetical protein
MSRYNIPETVCKEVLEEFFPGYIFKKVRLQELINPCTGRALELDLYNYKLNLALEYNGQQHYKEMKHFHRTKDAFEKQKIRDIIKEAKCNILNIELIEVPSFSKPKKIRKYIIKCLRERNLISKKVECKTVNNRNIREDSFSMQEKSIPKKILEKQKLKEEERIKEELEEELEEVANQDTAELSFRQWCEKVRKLPDSIEGKDDPDYEFMKELPDALKKYRDNFLNPPVDHVEISVYAIPGCNGDSDVAMNMIRSHLQSFMAVELKLSSDDASISKDAEYDTNFFIRVQLPQGVKFSYDEKNKFRQLVTKKNLPKKLSKFFVDIDDNNVPLKRFNEIVAQFFKTEGRYIPLDQIAVQLCGDSKIFVTVPEFYALGETKVTELETYVYRQIFSEL